MASVESVLIRGRCRFQFEGYELFPEGETGSLEDACWLHASPAVMEKIRSLLPTGRADSPFADWIEIAFYGHINPVRGHYGHLGVFRKEATIHYVIEARLLPHAVEAGWARIKIRESHTEK